MYAKTTEDRACKALLAAVVSRAVMDTFIEPIIQDDGTIRMDDDALSAFEFLSKKENVYMPFIDLEPKTFWDALVKKMYSEAQSVNFNDSQKRMFKINYKLWKQIQARRWLNDY